MGWLQGLGRIFSLFSDAGEQQGQLTAGRPENAHEPPKAPGAAVGHGSTAMDPEIKIRGEPLDSERCKFIVDRPVYAGGSVHFANREKAKGSPLAERLFEIEEVVRGQRSDRHHERPRRLGPHRQEDRGSHQGSTPVRGAGHRRGSSAHHPTRK